MATQYSPSNKFAFQCNEDVAITIRKARMDLGLSQSQTAEKLNICQQQFNRYETGQHEPAARMLIKIMRLFKLTVEDFYHP